MLKTWAIMLLNAPGPDLNWRAFPGDLSKLNMERIPRNAEDLGNHGSEGLRSRFEVFEAES